MRKKLIAFLVIFALIMSTVPAMADDADIIADTLIVRPLSLASIALCSVIFVAALPFSIPTFSVGTVGKLMVVDTFKFTFVRPVGDFNYKP